MVRREARGNAPDLMMFLVNRGYAITNDALKSGVEVAVLAAKAPDIWRSKRGIDLLGPRHFGFDYDYVPVEILVKNDATLSIAGLIYIHSLYTRDSACYPSVES